MNLPFRKKSIKLTQPQQKRIVTRANTRTKAFPNQWRAMAFHFEVGKLTYRKKARIALTKVRIVSFSKRRKVLRLVDNFTTRVGALEQKNSGKVLEREVSKERLIFVQGVDNILGKKSNKFLYLFFNSK